MNIHIYLNCLYRYYIYFPFSGLDTVFSTCGVDGIRVWTDLDKNGGRQALHVPGPPHAQANCIVFTKDGKCILSGWSDGCIRCYTPQTGKLIYMIQVCKFFLLIN